MSPVEQLGILLEKLKKKDRLLTMEIQLVGSWIKEHQGSMRPRAIPPFLSPHERNEYHSWRRVGCRLHQRRSELKTKQDGIQTHIRAVTERMEDPEIDFSNFPIFLDTTLEYELASVDACA